MEQLGIEERCENVNNFARHLAQVKDSRPICIVLDKAERLRDLGDGMIISTLVKLQEFTSLNIGIVLVSEIPYEKFRFGCGSLEPIQIFFAQYSKGKQLLTQKLQVFDCDLFRGNPRTSDERVPQR